MIHRYFAYGLDVASEIPLPHWPPGRGGRTDACISLGGVPAQLAGPRDRGPCWWTAPGEFLLDLPGVARFYVRHGEEIRVDPAPGGDFARLRSQLGGVVFGVLLHQRQRSVILHASAVRRDDCALVFAASSGGGKSTLMNAMLDRGWTMVADDICPVELPEGDGPAWVQPGIAVTRLWADAATELGRSLSGASRIGDLGKFLLPVSEIAPAAVPLRRIFVLSPHTAETVTLRDLNTDESFPRLMRLVYHRAFLAGLGLTQVRFRQVSRLAPRARVTLVQRPVARMAVREIADRISDLCT